ncbi:hypothetical protein TYRP_004416 [Tyrophagus putrescentiae]|nr:hypothetical protein TYRP_004416 [Tyrophagus putrescentiae]
MNPVEANYLSFAILDQLKTARIRPRCAVLVQVDNRQEKTLAQLLSIVGVFCLSPFHDDPYPNHQLELFVVEVRPATRAAPS